MSKPFRIKDQWVKHYPKHGYNLRFWCAVAGIMRDRHVRSNDTDALKSICAEVSVKMFGGGA